MISPDVTDPSGGHVFRRFEISPAGAVTERAKPARSNLRRSPPLFGTGLLELVTAPAIAGLADPDDTNRDGISGRIPNGRFGWKGRFRTIDQAVTAALANEMDLENDFFPITPLFKRKQAEISLDQIDAMLTFVRSLAPLKPAPVERGAARGRELFQEAGCAACHTPALPTTDETEIHPHTDLLLHNMGSALADGFKDGDIAADEFRTPPLWGVSRLGPPFLHDGRAKSLDEAIRAHGGEAAASAKRYSSLSSEARARLISFLNSL